MLIRHSRILGMAASLVAVAGFAANGLAQGTFTMKDVLKAWELRQNRVQSARFHFEEDRFVTKGSKGTLAVITPNSNDPLPKEDLSCHVRQIVTLDGPKIRYSSEGQVTWDIKGNPFEQSSVMTFDGEKVKSYTPRGTLGTPGGLILPGAPQHTQLISLLPLFLAYRATYPGLQQPLTISEFEKTKEVAAIDGRNCVALRLYARPPARGENTLWVDAERDFLPRRYTSSLNGKVHLQLDINYEADADNGWVPSAWRFVYYSSGGGLAESGDTKVGKYEINIPVDPGEFDVTFPPGTIVNEGKEEGIVKYIVREGVEKRLITEADRGKSYEDVLNEDSNRIGLWKTATGFFAVGLIIALVILWRRKLSRSRRATV